MTPIEGVGKITDEKLSTQDGTWSSRGNRKVENQPLELLLTGQYEEVML